MMPETSSTKIISQQNLKNATQSIQDMGKSNPIQTNSISVTNLNKTSEFSYRQSSISSTNDDATEQFIT